MFRVVKTVKIGLDRNRLKTEISGHIIPYILFLLLYIELAYKHTYIYSNNENKQLYINTSCNYISYFVAFLFYFSIFMITQFEIFSRAPF